MARPTKLNAATQTTILNAIREGVSLEGACDCAGIDYATMRNWIVAGEAALAADELDNPFAVFVLGYRQAQGAIQREAVTALKEHWPNNFRAAETFLARRFPESWGLRDQHTVTHRHEPQAVHHIITLENVGDLAALLGAAEPGVTILDGHAVEAPGRLLPDSAA